jgi:hypothetical protein
MSSPDLQGLVVQKHLRLSTSTSKYELKVIQLDKDMQGHYS